MPKVSKKVFAGLCDVATNYLAVMAHPKRGKVVVGSDGLMDTDDSVNAAYLQKKGVEGWEEMLRAAVGGAVEASPKPPAKGAAAVPFDGAQGDKREVESDGKITFSIGGQQVTVDLNDLPDFKESDRLKKYLETQIQQLEIQKRELDLAKKNGEVVPADLMAPILKRNNQHILMYQKNADDDILRDFGHKYEISNADLSVIRGEWVVKRNKAMADALQAAVSEVGVVVNEFKVRKGVGERN